MRQPDESYIPDKKYYGLDGVEFVREDTFHFIGKGPKDYDPDKRIWEEACIGLTFHSEVDASNIEVKVKNGVVTLLGEVLTRKMKKLAEKCVENVPGVSDVENYLKVKRSFLFSDLDESEM